MGQWVLRHIDETSLTRMIIKLYGDVMSAVCQLLGTRPQFGKRVSHSHRRTSRRFNPNIQTKRYFVPSLGRTVALRLSARGIKTIDAIGIEAAVQRVRANGWPL